MNKNNKCLNPHCTHENNFATTRGLCHGCYGVAHHLVKQQKTTWENLEAAGKAKASQRRSYNRGTTNWLLETEV